MTTVDATRREFAAFAQIAMSSAGLDDFRRRALVRLRGAVSFDFAWAWAPGRDRATAIGKARRKMRSFDAGRDRYLLDLAPIAAAAAAAGGVTIDTRVLGPRERAARPFYAQLAIPRGIRSLILALVPVLPGAGPPQTTILLARTGCSPAFRQGAIETVAGILPVLALGEALCSLRGSRSVVIDETSLSPRESQVASLVARGMCNREVAERCGTSVNTVRKQLSSVFDKLGVASRSELAARAAQPPAPELRV
jgi:DNA-binding CsgD family transcriptional regulator